MASEWNKDHVRRFIAAKCTVGTRVRVEELLRAYREWATLEGKHQLEGNALGRAFTALGYPLDSTRKYRCFLRILRTSSGS